GMYPGYTTQPPANTYWGQPIVKTETSPFDIEHLPTQSLSSPGIRAGPETTEASSSDVPTFAPAIKQEQDPSMPIGDLADPEPIVVKQEPGTTFAQQAPPLVASTHPLSHTISAYFDRHPISLTAMPP